MDINLVHKSFLDMATPTQKNSTLLLGEFESLPHNLSSSHSINTLSPILPKAQNFHGNDENNNDQYRRRRRHAEVYNDDYDDDDDNDWLVKKSIYCKTIKSNGLREQSFMARGKYKCSENSENDDDNADDIDALADSLDDNNGDENCENADDGTTEIPIWICGEPRFVSGVNEKTSCNDVIQALIDDELSEKNMKNVAASRDLNDYVITEKWRDVEQILTGETLILPIWNAWGVAQNEVKFRLKINRTCPDVNDKEQTLSIKFQQKRIKIDTSHNYYGKDAYTNNHRHRHHKKSKTEKISFLSKMLKKILRQGEEIENQLTTLTTTTKIIDSKYPIPALPKNYPDHLLNSDDELLLVIDSTNSQDTITNDDAYLNDSGDSGVHIKPCTNFEYNSIMSNIRSIEHEDDMCPDFPTTTTSLYKLKTIHYDIKEKLVENTKLQKEKLMLKAKLNKRYYQYNCENNFYKKMYKLESHANIDRIQENLEIYKRDIIQIEYEILKIKLRLNDNLRMLSELNELLKLEKRLKMRHSFGERFTDDIFEFSDNNDTLIV